MYCKHYLKKFFLYMILEAVFLFICTISSWALPMARIDILDPMIYPEEQFIIDIVATGVESLDAVLSFGMDIDFDSSWTLDNVAVGSGFLDDSFLWPDTDVAGSAMPAIPGGSDILLASFYFTPHQTGIFNFGILSDITLYSEGLFTFEHSPPFTSQIDITTSTSVSVVSVVPEPASGFLIFLGLGFIGLIKKKN